MKQKARVRHLHLSEVLCAVLDGGVAAKVRGDAQNMADWVVLRAGVPPAH